MSTTVIGPVFDELGQGMSTTYGHHRNGANVTHRRCWATPAWNVRRRQAARIPIDYRHGHRAIGQVVHLELRGRHLWAVGELDGEIQAPGHDLYWSAEVTHVDGDDVLLEWLSLTPAPAQSGLRPLQFLPGALDFRGAEKRWSGSELNGVRRELCERAAVASFHRRDRGHGPIEVYDAERERALDRHFSPREKFLVLATQADEIIEGEADEAWQHQPLRYRPSRVVSVR